MNGKQRRTGYCSRLVLLAAALLLAACSGEPEQPLEPGQAEYVKYCATCHARDGSGRPPTFPPLAGSEWLALGPDASALIVLLGLKGEIEVAGRTYRGYMPSMRQLSDAELAAILGFVGERWADWDDIPDVQRIAQLRSATEGRAMLEGRSGLDAALEDLSP
jgi:mono/diheme cytochrome c family protein